MLVEANDAGGRHEHRGRVSLLKTPALASGNSFPRWKNQRSFGIKILDFRNGGGGTYVMRTISAQAGGDGAVALVSASARPRPGDGIPYGAGGSKAAGMGVAEWAGAAEGTAGHLSG